MSILNAVENIYLTILRLVVLTVATLAICAAVVMSFSASSKIINTTNREPVITAPENPKLEDFISFNKQKPDDKDDVKYTIDEAKNQEQYTDNNEFDESLNNIIYYFKNASLGDIDKNNLRNIIIKNYIDKLDEDNRDDYITSLKVFSTELLHKIDEQKALVKEIKKSELDYNDAIKDTRFIDIDRALQWHLATFSKNVERVDAEFKQKYQEREQEKNEGIQELYVAAGSFAIFLLVVFLFIIIKIERNLRGVTITR